MENIRLRCSVLVGHRRSRSRTEGVTATVLGPAEVIHSPQPPSCSSGEGLVSEDFNQASCQIKGC